MRELSLADCFTISTGEELGMDTVFAKHEELDRELSEEPFKTRILFSEDNLRGDKL